MSGRRSHRERINKKLSYIAQFDFWAYTEPPMIFSWEWRKWLKRRPTMEDFK